MIWLWVLISFILGFAGASVIWCVRFRDKIPVGCLIEAYDEKGDPEYYLKFGSNSIGKIAQSKTVVMAVLHYKGGSPCPAEDHMNKP